MQFKTALLSALVATATAAPRGLFDWDKERSPEGPWSAASGWLNRVATNLFDPNTIQDPPTCDLSKLQFPANGDMPGPDSGLVIHHIALGRGTQNYTCDTSNPASAPVAAGAVATLFNVTCWTAMWPQVVEAAPSVAVHLKRDTMETLNPWGLSVSGHHYFRDSKTPFFDLNTSNGQYGVAPCAKLAAANAPTNAATGLSGEAAVPWLKLNTVDGATGGMKNVFRTSTAGGSAPATCQGQPAQLQVEYSALYWYYSTS